MEPSIYKAPGPFVLETGHTLPELRIAYHTYGKPNAAHDNVVWVCHALTANSDVADWWPHTVEAGCFLDPARHFVVCANILGSHYGTTGPLHVNPETGSPYYKDFPPFTIRDIVRAHRLLAGALGIGRIDTLVGSSVGGFQAIEWAVLEPERIGKLILIATAAKASPWTIAIDQTQRMAIEADTTFGEPRDDAGMAGLAAARALGLLTYRGSLGYNLTQQDREELPAVHRASTYQQYQGEKLCRRYNAYSYYAILNAFDTHDTGRGARRGSSRPRTHRSPHGSGRHHDRHHFHPGRDARTARHDRRKHVPRNRFAVRARRVPRRARAVERHPLSVHEQSINKQHMSKIKIGLFGFGVVGQGIYQVVQKSKNAHAEIVKICVRDPEKPRKVEVDKSLFTTSADEILDNRDINLIVEVIDQADAAYSIVKRALLRGIPVVSGNKTMLAHHLPELIEIQKTHNVALLYDASSCGSIPVIRNLEEYYDNDLLLEVKGILNGSSNYILSRVFDHAESYDSALAQAQALGFAESDPSFDIEGYDSLFKLVIITVHALGTYVAPEKIFTYGISTIHDSDIRYAREKNVKIKLVAQVVKVSDEHFTMFVMPEFVTPSKYIYSVDDEYNGVVIRGECYDRQFMFGKGAGSLPTASSILSDIMARLNNYRYEYKKQNYMQKPDYTTDITLKVYVRYKETDVHGILNFTKVHEQYTSEDSNYVIGDIQLSELLAKRDRLRGKDVFLANIPIFFLNRDN